jgi:hypothetical protein
VASRELVVTHQARRKSRHVLNATNKINSSAHDERACWRVMARQFRPGHLFCECGNNSTGPDGESRLARSGGTRRFLCGDALSLVRRVTRRNVGESSRISRHRQTFNH